MDKNSDRHLQTLPHGSPTSRTTTHKILRWKSTFYEIYYFHNDVSKESSFLWYYTLSFGKYLPHDSNAIEKPGIIYQTTRPCSLQDNLQKYYFYGMTRKPLSWDMKILNFVTTKALQLYTNSDTRKIKSNGKDIRLICVSAVYRGFWWGTSKGTYRLGDMSLEERMILKGVWKAQDAKT